MGKRGINMAAAVAVLSLAACDAEVAAPGARDAATAAAVIEASGSGVVTAVDEAAGTVTIEHGEMPDLKWPPMTMVFPAPPELLTGISPGDEVAFDLSVAAGRGEITALTKR
jgi:Cu(I)/Ag(I) efflux system protein CusF